MASCRRSPYSALLLASLLALVAPPASRAHGPAERHEEVSARDEAAMKIQHERMGRFKEAMQALSNAVILGDMKTARENAEKLVGSLAGSEKDTPHKKRARRSDFRALYAELEKRIVALRAALYAGDLPKAGVAYGRVLEACASCHRQFRD